MEDKHVNWLELPEDVTISIAAKISFIKDYIRFGAVCRYWRRIYTANLKRQRRLPLLMVSSTEKDDESTRSLYSISDNTVIPNIKLQVPYDRWCRGSSEGWLVVRFKSRKEDVRLLNPFSGAEIQLPPLTDFPYETEYDLDCGSFLKKAILSANPSANPNYFVMVIYGDQYHLALFKPGGTWITLDDIFSSMEDVIYWRDRFYMVDSNSNIYTCDQNHPTPTPQLIKVAHPPQYNHVPWTRYLVFDSNGDLLLIARSNKGDPDYDKDFETYSSFEVFKLKQGGSSWTRMHTLDGHALFLGANSSLSFLASDFPACKPDCIYFTDDELGWPFGVFNLAHQTFEQVNFNFLYPVPIWIQQQQILLPCSSSGNNNNNKAATTESNNVFQSSPTLCGFSRATMLPQLILILLAFFMFYLVNSLFL